MIRIDILTLFPALLAPLAEESILGAAVRRGLVALGVHDLRAFATDRHRVVDDAP